jgi:hypothetical protein
MSRKAEPKGKVARLRSAYLIADRRQVYGDPPFRQNFLMGFPPRDQRALRHLAKLLYFKEDLDDEHLPMVRGSHNLAQLQAAAVDLMAIAQSLAYVAEDAGDQDQDWSKLDVEAAKFADRFAVRAARLAKEILAAQDTLAPPRARRSRTATKPPRVSDTT